MATIRDNTGKPPRLPLGRKVMVRLFNGMVEGPWPANGQGKCNWRISDPPHPFGIKQWRVAD